VKHERKSAYKFKKLEIPVQTETMDFRAFNEPEAVIRTLLVKEDSHISKHEHGSRLDMLTKARNELPLCSLSLSFSLSRARGSVVFEALCYNP
jgi:hypothetical protein